MLEIFFLLLKLKSKVTLLLAIIIITYNNHHNQYYLLTTNWNLQLIIYQVDYFVITILHINVKFARVLLLEVGKKHRCFQNIDVYGRYIDVLTSKFSHRYIEENIDFLLRRFEIFVLQFCRATKDITHSQVMFSCLLYFGPLFFLLGCVYK